MPSGIYKRTKPDWKIGKSAWNRGRKMSRETRRKMSLAKRGKPSWKKGKKFPDFQLEKHPNWRGGKTIHGGYFLVKNHVHKRGGKLHYVREHILVAEKMLGRYLKKGEVVHHKNHNRLDNSIENLEIFPNHSEHMKTHWKEGLVKRRKPY